MSDAQNTPESKPGFKAELPSELLRVLIDLLGQKAREATKSVYANAINLQVNELDVKIIFGDGQPTPNWHTAVTMPWTLVKLLIYYLQSNLAVHEIANGTIKLPASFLPASLVVPSDLETNPTSKEIFESLQAYRTKLMDEQIPLHKDLASE